MSKISVLDRFEWRGSNRVYALPWLRNRIEFSAEPDRIREYTRSRDLTRSQLTMDMLVRFHLSKDSIVVSNDEHAKLLRDKFTRCLPEKDAFYPMTRQLVDRVLSITQSEDQGATFHLAPTMIREVYFSLLENLLGASLSDTLVKRINEIEFKPGTRPVHLEGIMFALGLQLPGLAIMRTVVDLLYFRGEHYTRGIAAELEGLVHKHADPKPGSWYAVLRRLREQGDLDDRQYRGELTSVLVSSFSLSSALASLMLCLAARPEYVPRVRENRHMARCFVMEVLRLYPPFRRFGYQEKGIWERSRRPSHAATDFMVSLADLHLNPDAWEAPERFSPERFLASRASGGYKYMPFGMGARACIGKSYSMQTLMAALDYLCSKDCPWQLRLPDDYRGNNDGLPLPVTGRLVSFAVDDRIEAFNGGQRSL